MTRVYCDRCEELIEAGKYQTGLSAQVENDKKPHIPWVIEVKIHSAVTDWKLCPLCATELIHEAIKNKSCQTPGV